MNLKSIIPTIFNWPKPGVNFLDITPILESPDALAYCTTQIVKHVQRINATSIVAVESRGFPFAATVAHASKLPMVLARKSKKLPGAVYQKFYETEYSTDCIEIKQTAQVGSHPVVIDDLLATGGTILAVAELLRKNFAVDQVSSAVVINLKFLPGHDVLASNSIDLFALEDYV
jgi:adenine phosphoribosyltransferase